MEQNTRPSTRAVMNKYMLCSEAKRQMPADHVIILAGKTTNLLSRNYDFYPSNWFSLFRTFLLTFEKNIIWKSKKNAEK